MCAVQSFGKVVVEGSSHGLDGLQLIFHQIQVLFLQHLCIHGCIVGIVRENIPSAEDDVFQVGQRNDIFDAFLFAILHAHGGHLRNGTYWLGQAFAGSQHTRYHGGCYSTTHADYQHTQMSGGRFNVFSHCHYFID